MKTINPKEILNHFKNKRQPYNEDFHCELFISIMTNKNKGTVSAFCVEAMITERTFQKWVNEHELFGDVYSFCKMFARESWEQDGRELKDRTYQIGTICNAFEYWKLIGWSRFGVGKTSRIKLDLNPDDSPDKHYSQLLKQAASGDFTAGEIKQLMEAINVGLNTHQVFALQKEIDQLKSDLGTMKENTSVHNTITTKGTPEKD